MPTPLGTHARRLKDVASLRTPKGRHAFGQFSFEGATLLAEALAAGLPVEELYVTRAAYESTPLVQEAEVRGIPAFLIEPAAMAHISDLTTPSGLLGVATAHLSALEHIFGLGMVLVLADVADPANAGTLLRSADAFGCAGVVFGSLGVEPYHPKVVRGSMGAVFRLGLATGDAASVAAAAAAAGVPLFGLAAAGEPLSRELFGRPAALVVGNERHGLGGWAQHCERLLAIPMTGPAESLSAGVAGSIALYEASRSNFCQESTGSAKSQDYRG